MKFEAITKQHGATYAVFSMETPREREFFKNIREYMFRAPSAVSDYLIDSSVPSVLGWDSDRIDILVDSGTCLFLNDLFKNGVVSENFCEQVYSAVTRYNEELKV